MNFKAICSWVAPFRVLLPMLALGGVVWGLAGCQGNSEADSRGPLIGNHVATSNYPLAYFAGRLGGGAIEVDFAVPPASDPSFWRPDDSAIHAMQQAKLVLLNGATYEKWLPTVTLSDERVVQTADGFSDQWIEIENAITHSHGPGREHAHAGYATHTWLDPQLARQQLTVVAEQLAAAFPDQADAIDQQLTVLQQDMAQLDQRLADELAPLRDQPLLASHPVYQYLGRRLGADLKSVVWEPSVTPNAAEREELEEILKSHPAKIMLWEAEPAASTRQYLAELGIQVVVFETCGHRPATGDYLSAMNGNLDRLAAAVQLLEGT